MGSIWLADLADVVEATGLEWRCWPGWETRARSSGGYDAVYAVFCHHTASSTTPDGDCEYMWDSTSGDQPIGALHLARDGLVTVGAAGATNTQGKGGPWSLSHGTIPLDKGNAFGIAIEAANNGTGETWPDAQCDAYVTLVGALCDAYGLDCHRDVLSHCEWCQPSCPGRKIDPAGPSPWAYGGTWDMDLFRDDVAHGVAPAPEPEPEPDDEEDDMRHAVIIIAGPGSKNQGAQALAPEDLTSKVWIRGGDINALRGAGYDEITLDGATFDAIPG